MTEVKVFDLTGQPVGAVKLSPKIWDGPVRLAVLSQAVAAYRTNGRAGLASTKRRGEVSGGGKKPWKQKHTGRARAGSIRSPLWRGGGSVFGPKPRLIRQRLPEAIKRLALIESLKGKLRDEELVVLDRLQADTPSTKPFGGLAKAFGVERRSVIVLDSRPDALAKSLRNLARITLCDAKNLNAFDVLNAQKIFVTREALARLEQRVKDGGHAAGD